VALYLEHFGLSEPPFRITPHTDFFFEGADRGATLEALSYAVLHDEGIVKVSGEVGSGKTMMCRMLMERLPPHVVTIYLATPSFARDEILQAIADELELKLSERRTVALRALQEHLIRLYGAGRRVVIMIDEAHVMPDETLEQVRLLSNLESSRHKLLQIMLFGQPELDATLAKASLRQLRDRITHSFRMRPLPAGEVARYVAFRLRAAGYKGPDLFVPRACVLLARATGGLTRRINILADKALLAAYSEASYAVTERHVRAAVADAELSDLAPRRAWRPAAWIGLAAALGLAAGAAVTWWLGAASQPVSRPAAAPIVAVPPPAPTPAPKPRPAAATPAEIDAEIDAQETLDDLAEAAEEPEQPLLSAGQRRRLESYSPAGFKLLSERLAATREALEQTPDDRYAIELFVTANTEPARMEGFLVRARRLVSLDDLYVIPMGADLRLRVVYGQFDSAREAAEAQRRLPPKYQEAFRTSSRSFADLRKQM
jgi:type II secretory pathway predicted ATPase ExeA